MRVILKEANDNRPIFQGSNFDIEVKEVCRTSFIELS